jgi:large subunit ribosomal protein L19
MPTKTENIIKPHIKTDLQDIRPGDTVKVHQKVKEKDKERIQTFEGLVISKKHGKESGATITVRKVTSGVGVEKIIPIHSPIIDKIEIVKRGKVRRAKLYYIREARGRKAKLKNQDFSDAIPVEKEEIPEEIPQEEKTGESPEEKTGEAVSEEKTEEVSTEENLPTSEEKKD